MGFFFKKIVESNAGLKQPSNAKQLAIEITNPYNYTNDDLEMIYKHTQLNFIGFDKILQEKNLKKQIKDKVFYKLVLFFYKAYIRRSENSTENELCLKLYKLGYANVGNIDQTTFVKEAEEALKSEYCMKRLNSHEVDDLVRYGFKNMNRIFLDKNYEISGEDFLRFGSTRKSERIIYFRDTKVALFGSRFEAKYFDGINVFGISLINCENKIYLNNRKSEFKKYFDRFQDGLVKFVIFVADPKYLRQKIEDLKVKKESLNRFWPDLNLEYQYDDAENEVKRAIEEACMATAKSEQDADELISVVFLEHEIEDPRSMTRVFNQVKKYLREIM